MRLKLYRDWWYAVWRENGQTQRRALRTQDRGAAERALADLQRPGTGDTVASIYAGYLADKGTERAARKSRISANMGTWDSVRDAGAASSNLATPTKNPQD